MKKKSSNPLSLTSAALVAYLKARALQEQEKEHRKKQAPIIERKMREAVALRLYYKKRRPRDPST